MTVGRGGPKLHPFTDGSCTPYSTSPPPPLQPGQKYCEMLVGLLTSQKGQARAQGTTLNDFSKLLRPVLDRPVINKTGVTGKFDIQIEFSLEGTFASIFLSQPSGDPSSASNPTGSPSIFTAFQEQLGLKLEPGKGPVDRFVIDHIEKPTEN